MIESSEPSAPEFGEDAPPPVMGGQQLVLDLDGYEGPLDLLLDLARDQKVDLAKISMLALAQQYLDYIESARMQRLEVVADYLVMAAWLAYLKSRLLLPDEDEDGALTADEMASLLNWRLQQLQAMREAAKKLTGRAREGQEFFLRGGPGGIHIHRRSEWQCELYDLLKAYGAHREAQGDSEPLNIRRDEIIPMEMALARMRRLLGELPEWSSLQAFMPPMPTTPFTQRSGAASTLLAALELARLGDIELKQGRIFGPIYVRGKVRK